MTKTFNGVISVAKHYQTENRDFNEITPSHPSRNGRGNRKRIASAKSLSTKNATKIMIQIIVGNATEQTQMDRITFDASRGGPRI